MNNNIKFSSNIFFLLVNVTKRKTNCSTFSLQHRLTIFPCESDKDKLTIRKNTFFFFVICHFDKQKKKETMNVALCVYNDD